VVIIVVAIIVWMVSAEFLLASARTQRPSDDTPARDYCVTGSTEVDGRAQALVEKAASMLAKGNVGTVKITAKAADRITFERIDGGVPRQPWFRGGELRFVSISQGRTRIEWDVELSDRISWLLWVGMMIQVLSLLVLTIGGWAIYTYIVSSPNPALRWQTLQMLQVSHFLWPPFLMGGLYRQGMKQAAAQFEALANNLPYMAE
jgi:hypothetical protein